MLDGVREGLSLEERQDTITLDQYDDSIQYQQWRPLNVEGMYNQLKTLQVAD